MLKSKILILIILVSFSCKKRDEIELQGNVSGIVTDALTLMPVKGVEVSIVPSSQSQVTGEDGKFSFQNLNSIQYTIQTKAYNYESNTKTIEVKGGETIKGDIAITPQIPILKATPENIDFGSNLTQVPIEISNGGKGVLEWSISENITWLSVNPIAGTTTNQKSSFIITVERSLLTETSINQQISIVSSGGNKTISININK